ncbi:hypothetical protein ACF0H5_022111 [Mactra antiquata]
MGLFKSSVVFCFLLITYRYISRYIEGDLPVVLDGYYHPDFQPLVDIFRKNLENGKEKGGALSVYHKGVCLFDMWGGYADLEANRPWDQQTITMAFSASKGVAAIIVAKMVDMGLIDYKRPISDYWPEFSQKDKGNITVEMLLSHQAGLPLLDEYLHLRDIIDNPDKVERILAAQSTVWPPGSEFGYHGVTYGLYVDTLIRKVDPKHRNVAQFFRDEIGDPFDLDMFINTPKEEHYRVARLHTQAQWKMLLETLMSPKYFPILGYLILFPDSLLAHVAKAVVEFTQDLSIFNNPELREVPLTSASVTTTASGMAKLYGILANGGSTADGKQFLTKDQVTKLSIPLVRGIDSVIRKQDSMFGPGTGMILNPKGQIIFGHTGHGGQVGMADLHNNVGFMYITNHISIYGLGDDPRYLDLEIGMYKCLDNYVNNSH